MNEGKELWNLQELFTKKFWATKGGMPKAADLVAVTKDYALHAMREISEVVDELPWRMHRLPDKVVDRSNVLEEMVDAQKFLWGMMQVWGFTYEEFAEEFKRKSMVVEQRFEQEQSFSKLAANPCVIVDIDGVLADWESGFYRYIRDEAQTFDFIPREAEGWTEHQVRRWYKDEAGVKVQEDIKREFRASGRKAHLNLLPGARELLQLIRSDSTLSIILLTNRPYDEHYRIYPDTLEWLAKNNLPYDAILWARDKGFEAVKRFKNICWAVDDKAKNVKRLREAGITTILVDPNDPERDTSALLGFVRGLRAKKVTMEHVGFAWNKPREFVGKEVSK